MIDWIVIPEDGVAVETSRAERLLQRQPSRSERDTLPAEQMAGDIGHILVEELVHPPHILDPEDFQRRLEQARQPSETGCNPRPEDNLITMRRYDFRPYTGVHPGIVVEEGLGH